jgi:2-polyprenyl-3-methyl-5-hydroxy-6-metoxy-1,4-benzoquinol methylase
VDPLTSWGFQNRAPPTVGLLTQPLKCWATIIRPLCGLINLLFVQSKKELTTPGLSSFYESKPQDYFSNPRTELIALIDRNELNILEIGCGRGDTGKVLRETGKARSLTGVELVPEHARTAASIFDKVHVGSIEQMKFDWDAGTFDCIVLGDVLEHLVDPWELLKRLRTVLAGDGIVVASVPNVKHWPVIANLIMHDDWKYAEDGVLDITHLRFFTRKNTLRMFSDNGYGVEAVRPYFNGRRYSIPNKMTFGACAGFLAERWLVRLKAPLD